MSKAKDSNKNEVFLVASMKKNTSLNFGSNFQILIKNSHSFPISLTKMQFPTANHQPARQTLDFTMKSSKSGGQPASDTSSSSMCDYATLTDIQVLVLEIDDKISSIAQTIYIICFYIITTK